MIAYKDFRTRRVGLFSGRTPIDMAVKEANEWIARRSPEVINVETVVKVKWGFSGHRLRVWYRNDD